MPKLTSLESDRRDANRETSVGGGGFLTVIVLSAACCASLHLLAAGLFGVGLSVWLLAHGLILFALPASVFAVGALVWLALQLRAWRRSAG